MKNKHVDEIVTKTKLLELLIMSAVPSLNLIE